MSHSLAKEVLIFRALSNPTRIRLVHMLHGRDLCVSELAQALEVAQPTISQQLSHLKQIGFIAARKKGAWTYYSLSKPANEFQSRLLDALKLCFERHQEFRDDAERLSQCIDGRMS